MEDPKDLEQRQDEKRAAELDEAIEDLDVEDDAEKVKGGYYHTGCPDEGGEIYKP